MSAEISTCTTLSLHNAVGIVNKFMEDKEKVVYCEVPGCNKKLSGNTYMCCRPMETVTDMSHKGHTCCEECATTENYIEKNRCKVCLAVATGRRSGTKGAGYPLQPPQLNVMATNMLKVLRDTEDSVITARDQADDERRQAGADRRAAALEEQHAKKKRLEEEARAQAAEEVARAQRAEAKAKEDAELEARRAAAAEERAKKTTEEAEKRAALEAKRAADAEKRATQAAADAEKRATQAAADAEKKAKKAAADAEKRAEERIAAATRVVGMTAPEDDEAGGKRKAPAVSDEVKKERAERAKRYREEKKEKDRKLEEKARELQDKADAADMYQWQVDRLLEMAKERIAALGGNEDEFETNVIDAFNEYGEEDDEEDDEEEEPAMLAAM